MSQPPDNYRPCFRCGTVDTLNSDFLCLMCGDPDAPPCTWHAGCDQPGDPDTDGLCPFHFDACERSEHAEAQRQHEARVAALEAEIEVERQKWARVYELAGSSTVSIDGEAA